MNNAPGKHNPVMEQFLFIHSFFFFERVSPTSSIFPPPFSSQALFLEVFPVPY